MTLSMFAQEKKVKTVLTMTDEESLLYMLEEEKLARDVYTELFGLWGANKFNNISTSEQTHMNEVEALLIEYEIAYSILPSGEYANEKFKKRLTKKFNIFGNVIAGKVSSIFENYENYNGETSSLSDYKGKYVYIDVWNTWCVPCKAEIQALKKLNKQYKDKDIVFISISVDEKRAHKAWRDMIKDEEMNGVQLYAPNNWNSKFVQEYGITGIPRFILIDKEGKIINSNAPRPSDPGLVMLFNKMGVERVK